MAEPAPSAAPDVQPEVARVPVALVAGDTSKVADRALRPLPWVLIAPLALAPILLAVTQLGRWHPDEVYQFLEPAWFRVHGFGIRAWEWNVGLRNWGVPLVFASLLRVCEALGINDPRSYRAVLALPQLALHALMLVSVWRYMERRLWHVAPGWSVLAFGLVALFAPVVLFAGRTMGESISAALLVIACERLDREDDARGNGLWAGGALGLSVVARYGSAVFVMAAVLYLAVTRRWRLLWWTCAAGLAVAAGLGALDAWTWGKPFHSLRAYLEFNVFSGRAAAQFGSSPAWYYLPVLGMWAAAWAWPGVLAATFREKRLPLAAFAAGIYVLSVSATAHKEDRFLYPALVLFALASAPGIVWLISKVRSAWLRVGAAALALLAGFAPFAYPPDFRGDQFHGIVRATRDEGATGLLIVGDGLWGSGGQFYIGKNVPFWNVDHAHQVLAAIRNPRLNRVVSMDRLHLDVLQQNGFRIVDRVDRATILWRNE